MDASSRLIRFRPPGEPKAERSSRTFASFAADELMNEYRQLRERLEGAYRAWVWDSELIGNIADDLIVIEKMLGASEARQAPSGDEPG